MKYLIGIQSFDQIRNEGYVYVDKIRMNKIHWLFQIKPLSLKRNGRLASSANGKKYGYIHQ